MFNAFPWGFGMFWYGLETDKEGGLEICLETETNLNFVILRDTSVFF
jgi:hypothetical protein